MNLDRPLEKTMTMEQILVELSKKRSIFHSEADLQHAFAWKLHEHGHEIRLEYKPRSESIRMHVDVWVMGDTGPTAIELKYRKRRLSTEFAGERFDLCDQNSHDQGSYDFLNDVQRLERLITSNEAAAGYAILLTNDPWYWKFPLNPLTLGAQFHPHDGRTVSGPIAWAEHAGAGSKRGREAPITLSGRYLLSWQNFSRPDESRYGTFRYLLVKVAPAAG